MSSFAIVIITMVLSAFFSGMEIAYLSANKLRLEVDKNRNALNSRLLNIYTKHPSRYISTMLVGNNIALVIYGLAFSKILEPLIYGYVTSSTAALLFQTLFSTLLILVFAEFLPKALFRVNPNLAINIFSIPVAMFYVLFYPITSLTQAFTKVVMKLFSRGNNVINDQEKQIFGRVDLDNLLNEHKLEDLEHIPENEIKLFKNALDFSKVKLRECIVPRPEIHALEIDSTISEMKQMLIETGFSKILIFENSIDHIVGYVHSSDLFKHPDSIKDILRTIAFVPETMEASKLLSKFLKQNESIAVVVDEFGGTAGIVTNEDILEEIFGEIEDEHDSDEYIANKIDENTFILSGRLEIDDLNERFHLSLPESESYKTIAGLIIDRSERIPKMQEVIKDGAYQWKILKSTPTRIELVELTIKDMNAN
ncbi:hemolysin family protein [Halosquirtibacter xylanolyticus]|uniref:hemolysin family protein n=1 Tax=Halosquirtibacter xylanolyticus TaxID=3374599 RepID=UPI00374A4682|nr:hemolysin family protein [Prolixibacteraceae bacterium]